MKLTADRMLKLMAYADGELEPGERAEVEGWLADEPDARRFVAEMGNLGELVRDGHDRVAAVQSFDVTDAVMAAALREESPKAAPVVSIEVRRQRTLRIGGGIVAALALAASVFLLARSKDEVPIAKAPTPAAPPVVVASAEPGGSDVEVEPIESQGESVQVFYLANESSPTTSVVVWVDEHGAK